MVFCGSLGVEISVANMFVIFSFSLPDVMVCIKGTDIQKMGKCSAAANYM